MITNVSPGEVLLGKYRVERLLGQGGMAYVVSAWHLHLQQRVAIKLLRPETAAHAEVVERFRREAQAASRIESLHVARVIDVDTLPDGAPFMVLEHLEGADLAQVLRERGPLHPGDVAGWARQACAGVAEAHALGIVHRDLKPANLFLARRRSGEGVIKVLDFGISKLREDTRLTATDVGMGSAEYMSPEQMRSAADVDARSDVWSLGVTLYELCTGTTPFRADGVAEVCTAVLMRDPAPPRQLRPDLPPGLEAVILRCLEKDPRHRFTGAAALSAALSPFVLAAPPVSVTRASLPVTIARDPEPPALPGEPEAAPPRPAPPKSAAAGGFPVLAGASVAVLGLIVVVIAFSLGRRGGGEGRQGSGRFHLGADTLYDAETRLTWQRRPAAGAVIWAEAKEICARAGKGFRLPEAEELAGLLAVKSASPPVAPEGFPATAVDVFWSASPAGPGAASVVHFSTGRRATSVITEKNRVRCVR